MSAPLYARIVFGISSVLFGIISIMWHDADTWQTPYRILSLPLGSVIGDLLMIALIAGGIGILMPASARTSSIVLIVVYSIFSLCAIPGIFAAPKVYVQYGAFFEDFSMLCGAVAMYAMALSDSAKSASFGRFARIGMGFCAVSFTLAQIVYLKFTASLVPTWIPPNQMFWTVLTTVAFGLAAIAILTNIKTRLATRLMTLMLALFGILIWVPAVITQPGAHGNWSEFALNFQITGAAWLVAELKSF